MPSKKSRAKASKQEVKHSFERLNHKDNTPKMKKLHIARFHFQIQKMLGRPIRKYNLIYTTDDGDMFYSEDDLSDGLIMGVLGNKTICEPINCGGWSMMYHLECQGMKDDKQFYMYANLSDISHDCLSRDEVTLDKFDYFTWKEEIH
tara:strand:- start:235 stop:675 length:441 start_codon:yes stop_codon:yes gene_type:complete